MQFDMAHLWSSMGWVAKGVVFTLLIMSIWSIAIMFDRWKLYSSAKAQSRKYAADVARLLKAGKLKEAVDLSSSSSMKSSHLAKVSLAGLQEWQFQGATGETDRDAALEAAKRAMQRATAVNLAASIAMDVTQSVLLVDANLRHPSVHEMFDLGECQGLADYLLDDVPIEQLLVHPGIGRFVFLP